MEWSLADPRFDVDDIVEMADTFFGHEADGIVTRSRAVFRHRVTVACTEQLFNKSREFIADIKATPLGANTEKTTAPIACTSLAWNKSGTLLFAGFSDNYIRVYKIVVSV
jgi:hypothetical protein